MTKVFHNSKRTNRILSFDVETSLFLTLTIDIPGLVLLIKITGGTKHANVYVILYQSAR